MLPPHFGSLRDSACPHQAVTSGPSKQHPCAMTKKKDLTPHIYFNARRAATSALFLLGSCVSTWLAKPNSSFQGFPKNPQKSRRLPWPSSVSIPKPTGLGSLDQNCQVETITARKGGTRSPFTHENKRSIPARCRCASLPMQQGQL